MSRSWEGSDWINCGSNLIADDPHLASKIIRKGLCISPDQAIGWFNLGLSYHQQHKIISAIRAYLLARTLANSPKSSINKNLYQDLLLAEQWKQGWYEMEKRSQLKKFYEFEKLLGASWGGHKDPRTHGKGLLVICEQGLGDTLMFARFAALLQKQGITIKLLCQPALVELLKICSELKNVETQRTPRNIDLGWRWVPLMSLPRVLEITSPPWPSAEGWMQFNASLKDRQESWRRILKVKPKHRLIGLHWQGNPQHEGSLYSRDRSISLSNWEKLANSISNNVEFVALQKGVGLEQWNRSSPLPFVSGQEYFNNSFSMVDSAAVASLCDLVVSADSGIVHLTGCLGIPTWVALNHTPNWRWGLKGDKSNWYRSLRLFRQPYYNDWGSVVQDIDQQLK